MAAATKTTTRKRTTRARTKKVDVIELKPMAIKQELGRRRNNQGKPKADRARSKAWYFPALGTAEYDQVLAGETVRKQFSTREVDFVLAPA